jgi:hypothetical protein
MRRRLHIPLVVLLGLASSCGNPPRGLPRIGPGTASLSARPADGAFACIDLAYEGRFTEVVVPADASCILAYGVVTGRVTVLPGGSLYSVGTRIHGDVESRNAASVDLAEVVIDGDVVIDGNEGAGPTAPTIRLAGSTLTRGNVRITTNSGVTVAVRDVDILEGDVRAHGNVDSFITLIAVRAGRSVHVVANGGAGSTMVRSTSAGHSMRCHANTTTFAAAGNDAPLMQGQCEKAAEVE